MIRSLTPATREDSSAEGELAHEPRGTVILVIASRYKRRGDPGFWIYPSGARELR